jgi:hypothetical protein
MPTTIARFLGAVAIAALVAALGAQFFLSGGENVGPAFGLVYAVAIGLAALIVAGVARMLSRSSAAPLAPAPKLSIVTLALLALATFTVLTIFYMAFFQPEELRASPDFLPAAPVSLIAVSLGALYIDARRLGVRFVGAAKLSLPWIAVFAALTLTFF